MKIVSLDRESQIGEHNHPGNFYLAATKKYCLFFSINLIRMHLQIL